MLPKEKALASLFWLLGYKVTNPGDHAARAKTSSLDALAFIVFCFYDRDNPNPNGFSIADSPSSY
jgi:hypothetical protein